MFDEFRTQLADYQRWRHPDLPPLVCSDPYILRPDLMPPDGRLAWPKDEWPGSESAGVYAIFGLSARLLYVGRAVILGRRLGEHFKSGSDGRCISPAGYTWTETPTFVITVAVPPDRGFEAGALEEFLIERLQPCDNTRIPGARANSASRVA